MILPSWPVPSCIKSLTLTKLDSADILTGLNIQWLNQIHKDTVITLPNATNLTADGAYTKKISQACVIRTADCLGILLCNSDGTEVAALHGGWRGLAKGIIANGVKQFSCTPQKLIAWLSPAICPKHYEVDETVYTAFIEKNAQLSICFIESRPNHWYLDLWQVARMQLQAQGVKAIFGGGSCTFEDEKQFYSYRRDPGEKGRLIHAIWIAGS